MPSPIKGTNASPRSRVLVSKPWVRCSASSKLRFWSSIGSINAWHRSNETSRRLDELPGVGPALATALVASVADAKAFRSGRDFSAWIGLVPKQNSSGGKEKLGSITKQGDRYLRSLFTVGALSVIRYAKIHGTKHRPWLARAARAPADEGRRNRARQQDRAHGLGHDGQGRALQGTHRTRPMRATGEVAPVGAV